MTVDYCSRTIEAGPAPRGAAREAEALLRPGRSPERVSAEAKGGAAGTVGCNPDGAAPADASIASAPGRGGRGRILSTAKFRRLNPRRKRPGHGAGGDAVGSQDRRPLV